MLMHYGFSYPPNVNKHSFLEVKKEELRDAVAIVSNTPSQLIDKRFHQARALKLKLNEMAISRYK